MTFGLVLLYIVLVIIRPQEYVQGMENTPILATLFVITFFSWLISVKKDFSVPQPALASMFFIVAIVSVAAAGWFGGSWNAFKQLLPSWGVFMILSMTIKSPHQVRLVLDVIAISAFVIAVHSVEQYLTGFGWTGLPIRPGDGRVHYLGIFNDPNDLGTLLVSTVPIIIHWLGRESTGMVKFVYLVMLATVLAAIFMTDSRGVLLAVGLIVLMEFGRRFGKIKAAVLGSILGMLAIGYTRISELNVDEASAAGRIEAWYQGIEMFKMHPMLGVGYANFTDYHERTAHNSFVLVLAETGVIGFYFWLALISITLVILINFLRKSQADLDIHDTSGVTEWVEFRGLAWTYLLMVLGYLTSIVFLSRSYDMYFYIVFGLGSGLCMVLQKRYSVVPNLRIVANMGGWAVSAIGGVIVTYIAVKVLFVMQS